MLAGIAIGIWCTSSNATSATGSAREQINRARDSARRKSTRSTATANDTQMIDSYMFVTGGRPAMKQRSVIAVAWNSTPATATATPTMRSAPRLFRRCAIVSKHKREPVAKRRAIKAVEVIVEILAREHALPPGKSPD